MVDKEERIRATHLVHGDVINFLGKHWSVCLISYRPTGKAIRAILVDGSGVQVAIRWDLATEVKLVSKAPR